MADSQDARNVMELEPVGKKSAKRKYEKEEDQILNVEHLHRDQKRPSFQASARRTSRETKPSLNSNLSDDDDDDDQELDDIVVVKNLEPRQPTCND